MNTKHTPPARPSASFGTHTASTQPPPTLGTGPGAAFSLSVGAAELIARCFLVLEIGRLRRVSFSRQRPAEPGEQAVARGALRCGRYAALRGASEKKKKRFAKWRRAKKRKTQNVEPHFCPLRIRRPASYYGPPRPTRTTAPPRGRPAPPHHPRAAPPLGHAVGGRLAGVAGRVGRQGAAGRAAGGQAARAG